MKFNLSDPVDLVRQVFVGRMIDLFCGSYTTDNKGTGSSPLFVQVSFDPWESKYDM